MDKCVEYILKKYEAKYNGDQPFYSYTTCALDTDNCQKVFEAVSDSLLNIALKACDLT